MEQSLHETHINLIKTEAILDFLFQQEKQQEQPQVPNSKDISKKLTLSAKEDGSILKRFFGHYEMVSTSEYYLLVSGGGHWFDALGVYGVTNKDELVSAESIESVVREILQLSRSA